MADLRRTLVALAAGAMAAAAVAAPFASSGCTVQGKCEEKRAVYKDDAGATSPGFPLFPLSDDVYESNPILGTWLEFDGQEYVTFFLPPHGHRAVAEVVPYISAEPRWFEKGANFAIASGNLAEIVEFDDFHITLKNETCADYYLRLLVRLTPAPSSGADGGSDAGDASDASPAPTT